jgi:hypothetical protein
MLSGAKHLLLGSRNGNEEILQSLLSDVWLQNGINAPSG